MSYRLSSFTMAQAKGSALLALEKGVSVNFELSLMCTSGMDSKQWWFDAVVEIFMS